MIYLNGDPSTCVMMQCTDRQGAWLVIQRHVPAVMRCACGQVMTICRTCNQRLVSPERPWSLPPVHPTLIWIGGDRGQVAATGFLWRTRLALMPRITKP